VSDLRFPNLKSYLDVLKQSKDLVVVDTEVDPKLEIAEIHRRVIEAGGPALLFTKVRGSSFPVVTNLFGTKKRVNLAFGAEAAQFVQRVAHLPEEILPPSLKKLWGLRNLGFRAARIGYRETARAPVLQHQIAGADLTRLPALTSWHGDGGPFLTLPLVHTKSVRGGSENLGMYRIQIHSAAETGMHFQIGKGGGFHLYEAEHADPPAPALPLPVNIYLGGPPALILAAIAPLPENVPELLLCSLVMGEKLKRGVIKDFPIAPVAEAEFCLSGFVPPHVRKPEGPFGDHYGYYSLKHDYPVFRPKAIYHRDRPVFPATIVGKPVQEDFFIGDYLQELLMPMIPTVMPGVRDLWSYGETGYHALSAAVLKERYGRESMASVFRILGEGQVSLTKFLLGIDKPLDLRNFKAVLTHVLERVDWAKDLFVFSELSMDTLDYSGPEVNKGSKGVILGLGAPRRQLPISWSLPAPSNQIRDVAVFAPGCLAIEGPSYTTDKEFVKSLAALPAFRDWPLLVVVDNARKATASVTSFLWTTFTRFEPAADIYAAGTHVQRNRISYEGPIVIDARMKPWYPDELQCDDATAALVNRRWSEYFPGGQP